MLDLIVQFSVSVPWHRVKHNMCGMCVQCARSSLPLYISAFWQRAAWSIIWAHLLQAVASLTRTYGAQDIRTATALHNLAGAKLLPSSTVFLLHNKCPCLPYSNQHMTAGQDLPA